MKHFGLLSSLLVCSAILLAETPEKIPSLSKALKLKKEPQALTSKDEKIAPFPNTAFDPSFLLDVDDDFSFQDALTDPKAAKEKEDHPELSTQVTPEVLGVPQAIPSMLTALPATPSQAPSVIETPVYGPQPLPAPTRAPAQVSVETLSPMLAGMNPFGAANQKLPITPSTPLQPAMGVPDVAIILSNNQFFPSRIRIKEGNQTRLIFATLNKKSAALIIEKLQVQRWIAKEDPAAQAEKVKFEVTKEISVNKTTEVVVTPVRGTYTFYDALSGAAGEIVVE